MTEQFPVSVSRKMSIAKEHATPQGVVPALISEKSHRGATLSFSPPTSEARIHVAPRLTATSYLGWKARRCNFAR